MNPQQPSSTQPSGTRRPQLDAELSALMDGEASPGVWHSLAGLDAAGIASAQTDWACYHLIGDALRHGADGVRLHLDAPVCGQSSQAFAQGVMQRVRQPGTADADAVARPRPVADPDGVPAAEAATQAANDALYRWRVAAGVATFAAVVGVAWGVGADRWRPAGAELASAPQAVPVTQVAVSAEAQPVWVSTPQGAVLRDARLEEMMLAHRQAGGASALQVPAGFLRNATFETGAR